MTLIKPYRSIPIRECGEPLVPIPRGAFAFFDPHPYIEMGASYGSASPWMLRRSVLESLKEAQQRLHRLKPGWKIKLFDAYRPVAVQTFLVDREFVLQARHAGLNPARLSESERERIMDKVFRLFAVPSAAPATPPPHSTGAAFDCTLADEAGNDVDMGSPIDENSDQSISDYFADVGNEKARQAHANRTFLKDLLYVEGMRRNPNEWWHFSRGDQLAIWIDRDISPQGFAVYGRADLL